VLEAAITFGGDAGQKYVTAHGGRPAEEIDVPGAEACQVGLQPLPVGVRKDRQDEGVGHACRQELHRGGGPHEYWVIDEFVVTGSLECAELPLAARQALEPGGETPCRTRVGTRGRRELGWIDVHDGRGLLLTMHAEEHANSIDEALLRVEPCAPH
jgi:hypothetical protein